MSSGSDQEPPQADEQMRAATEKLRHLALPPVEPIDLTEEPEPAGEDSVDLRDSPARSPEGAETE